MKPSRMFQSPYRLAVFSDLALVRLPGVLTAGILALLICAAVPPSATAQSAASQLSTMANQQIQVPEVSGPVCVPSSVSDCNFNSNTSRTTSITTRPSVQSQRAAQAQAARKAQQAQQMQQMQQIVNSIINGNPQIAAEVSQKQAEIQQANTAHALQVQQEQENYTVQTARSAQARRDQKIAEIMANTIGVPPDGDMSGLIKGLPPSQQPTNTALENNKSVAGSGFDTPGPLMAAPVKPVPKASEPFDYRKTEAKDIPPERRTPEVNKLLEHREELRRKEAELRKELANTPPNTQAWIDKSTAADKLHNEDNWDTFNISEELHKGLVVPSGQN